jgi:hypothetical protein
MGAKALKRESGMDVPQLLCAVAVSCAGLLHTTLRFPKARPA